GNGDFYLKDVANQETSVLTNRLEKADDERIFVLGELLRRGMTEKEVYEITKIDPLFINKLNHIINLEKELKNNKHNQKLLKEVKEHGFSDMQVARVWEMTEKEVYEITKIDKIFINKLNHIINLEKELKNNKHNQKLLKEVKEHGFSDMQVARVWEMTEKEVYDMRIKMNLVPVFKEVDTSAGITKANAP